MTNTPPARERAGGVFACRSIAGGSMARSASGFALIITGIVIIGIGLLVMSGALSWFGRLPGDIRIERPGTRIYIPIVSSILLSLLLSLVFSAVGAILRRFR
jgi:uncharacterized membrane protein